MPSEPPGFSHGEVQLDLFDYGNRDMSGEDGLRQAWFSSSLKISPREQVAFLKKMVLEEFPVSKHAYSMTKKILFQRQLDNGWKLYGKTGTGTDEGKGDVMWYAGWIEKGNRCYIFVLNIRHSPTVLRREERENIAFEMLMPEIED